MTTKFVVQRCSVAEFVEVMHGRLARALREGVADLVEPRHVIPAARAELARVVELVAGFALGTVLGTIVDGVRTWYGPALCCELQRSFVPATAERVRADVAYCSDREARPLVDAYAGQLHVRFARFGTDVRGVFEQLAELGLRAGVRDVSEVVRYLAARAPDLEERVCDEIRFAWAMYLALVSGRPAPSIGGRNMRSDAMWTAWQAVVRPASASVGARDAAQAAGYILLVG